MVKINEVRVSINRTVTLDIEMEQTIIEGEVVTVEVARLAQKKDQTGTIKNISGDEIKALPVESVGNVINMQAGVVVMAVAYSLGYISGAHINPAVTISMVMTRRMGVDCGLKYKIGRASCRERV